AARIALRIRQRAKDLRAAPAAPGTLAKGRWRLHSGRPRPAASRTRRMTPGSPSCKTRSHERVTRQRSPRKPPSSKLCGMPAPSPSSRSVDRVIAAFDVMGRYLRERELLGEIAVYGRTAILLQFRWGNPTEDVDVVIRTAEREGAVKDAAAFAALRLGLP